MDTLAGILTPLPHVDTCSDSEAQEWQDWQERNVSAGHKASATKTVKKLMEFLEAVDKSGFHN